MFAQDPGFDELIMRYGSWRDIALRAGHPAVDEPVQDGDRFYFREGYPYDGWTGYSLEATVDGYRISTISTERQIEPVESPILVCSAVEDAGKYLVWKVASAVRIALKLPSIVRDWRASGLDSRVKQISLDTYVSRFELIDDPGRYLVTLRAGGVQPENRLLPMSYDELDRILLEGIRAVTQEDS
jgi:hypothetical protein